MFYSNGAYSLFKVDTPVISGGATPPNPFTNTLSTTFDGVDDLVTMGDVLNMANDGTDPFSYSVWFKTTDTGSYQALVTKGKSTAWYNGVVFSMRGDLRNFYISLGTVQSNQRISGKTGLIANINDGNWHHVCLTYDGSQVLSGMTLYYDNSLVTLSIDGTQGTPNNVSTVGQADFMIGARGLASSPNTFFNGNIDETAVFNSELSASDVTSIYNGGVPNNLNDLSTPPLSWWRMGDGSIYPTINDEIGSNDGTMTNMTSANFVNDVPEFNTKSILLDGIDDFVRIGTTSLGITTAISVSAWVKTSNSSSNQYIIAEDPRSTNNRNWLLQFRANGEIQCVIWASNGSSITSAITPLTYNNGNWTHVLATFDGTTNANGLKIYVNGVNVVQATASVSGVFSSSSSEPIIGGDSTTPTLPFNGNIDEVAIWDNDQSANASAIYNSGTPNDITSLSPLSWWRCGDNDTAPILTDNGSGSNDGTMTNFSTFSTDVPT